MKLGVKTKSNSRRSGNFFVYVCLLATLWLLFGKESRLVACAAEGTVSFGSDAYAWNTGDVCPIGVYISSSAQVSGYIVCLEYDVSMLRYLDGADRAEENLIYLEGGGTEMSYKRMLHFEPLQAGTTTFRVVSAEGLCRIPSENGAGEAEEELAVVQLLQAPITIEKKGSSSLTSLEVPEAIGMESFTPGLLEYHFRVANDMEELSLSYKAEDETAVVEISETTLQEGNNTITITVQGERAEPIVYTLYVEREKTEALEEEKTEEGITEIHKGGNTDGPAAISKDTDGRESENGPETMEGTESMGKPECTDGTEDTGGAEGAGTGEKLEPALLIALFLVGIMSVISFIAQIRERRKQKHAVQDKEWKDTTLNMINLEQTVIDLRHVTMNFRLAQEEASSLKEYMIRMLKGQNHYRILTVLNNITLEVKQGDVLGIIGTNGSGKSTLLKIIAGALNPTKGEVLTDKSRVQMLTLGTGFDMELTARENVYLNGAIIGYTKEFIDEKYDDIVEFAELQGFMDERMKNFSSGMVSRLGFAIATMRDTPDILILDEVLSVGDMFFRKKSEMRIKEMIHSGATVLIVSHSADVICENCDKVIWIEKGEVMMLGEPKDVCRAYKNHEGKTA